MQYKSNQSTRTYAYVLSNNGIWFPAFGSLIKKGFRKRVTCVPISSTGTASSNSNARTSVNKSAFSLQITNYSSTYFVAWEGNVLYERESISNTRMWSTEECQHVAPYTWNGTRCLLRRLPTFRSISVAIDQRFWSRHRIHILKLPSIFPP